MTPEESLAKWKCCASLEEHKEHLAHLERGRKEAYEARQKNLAGLPTLIRALGGNPDAPPQPTHEELLKAVDRAGFRVAKNIAHPFIGATPEDEWMLWCKECGRDSGFHWDHCSKGPMKDV